MANLELDIQRDVVANHDYKLLIDAALARIYIAQELETQRKAKGLSQTAAAARMGTSESNLVAIEEGETDLRLSTLQRYAIAVGGTLELSFHKSFS